MFLSMDSDDHSSGMWGTTWGWSPLTGLFTRTDKQGLRGASRSSCGVVNATVRKVVISEAKDLKDLPSLRLHERFPNAETVILTANSAGSSTGSRHVPLDVIPKMTGATSLDPASCGRMDLAIVAQALSSCRCLRELALPPGRSYMLISGVEMLPFVAHDVRIQGSALLQSMQPTTRCIGCIDTHAACR